MKRIHLTPVTTRLLIVAAVLVAFGLTFYLMAGLPRPREANRVFVGNDAFSFIKPPDWEAKIGYGAGGNVSLVLRPAQWMGRVQTINVARIPPPTPADLAPMSEGEFQGQKAWLEYKTLKWEYLWRTRFQRGPYWYEIALHLGIEEDVPHSDWWPYLNSFRPGNGPSTTQAVQSPPRVSPVATTIPSGFGNVP